jgi:hypothetical protein
MVEVPWLAREADAPTMENSDYCMNAGHLKNCYLLFHADFDENCAYCDVITNSKDCIDCHMLDRGELCYESVNCNGCYRALHCVDCENSNDIFFCRDVSGCSNCFGCVGLRKKEYCFFNEQLTREEYERRLTEYEQGSCQAKTAMSDQAHQCWMRFPRKYAHGAHNENVSGDYIDHSKNTHHSFQVSQCEDSKYCAILGINPVKDSYDYTSWGNHASRIYECIGVGEGADMLTFSFLSGISSGDLEYSMFAINSSNLFGCISMRKKQYCILNKQYTKEEYEELIPKIKHHMNDMPFIDKKGRIYRYGEFFPTELSLYAYNESAAQEYFPLTKEAAITKGCVWRDRDERSISATLQYQELPDHIRAAPDTLTKEIITCEHAGTCNDQCTIAFKIITQELAFYRRMNLPLPRLCQNCRYAQRANFRNPMKLWSRQCQCAGGQSTNSIYTNTARHSHGATSCPATFQTSYAPERPDIVYCESCYRQEVV